MELLGLLLQLLKAAFGIGVDGVLGDFALHALLARLNRTRKQARRGESPWRPSQNTYEVESLLEGLGRLNHHVSTC